MSENEVIRLRRRVFVVKSLGVVCVAGVMVVLLVHLSLGWPRADRQADRLEARAFVVKNENGAALAVFGDLGFGMGLYIKGKDGKPRIKMAAKHASDSVGMSLLDGNGNERVVIDISKDVPVIQLLGQDGGSVCQLVCAPKEWRGMLKEWRIDQNQEGLNNLSPPFGFVQVRDADQSSAVVLPK